LREARMRVGALLGGNAQNTRCYGCVVPSWHYALQHIRQQRKRKSYSAAPGERAAP